MRSSYMISLFLAIVIGCMVLVLYRQGTEISGLRAEIGSIKGQVNGLVAKSENIGVVLSAGAKNQEGDIAAPELTWVCSAFYSMRTCLAYDQDGLEFGEVHINDGVSARAYTTAKNVRYERMDATSMDRGKRWLQAKFEESMKARIDKESK